MNILFTQRYILSDNIVTAAPFSCDKYTERVFHDSDISMWTWLMLKDESIHEQDY